MYRIFSEHHFLRRPLKCCFCQIINFSKALIQITTAIDTCIEPMALKTKYTQSNFGPWKQNVLAKVKIKIIITIIITIMMIIIIITTEATQKFKPKETRPV